MLEESVDLAPTLSQRSESIVNRLLLSAILCAFQCFAASGAESPVLVEAEGFADRWQASAHHLRHRGRRVALALRRGRVFVPKHIEAGAA
jgi:hypothetical protein